MNSKFTLPLYTLWFILYPFRPAYMIAQGHHHSSILSLQHTGTIIQSNKRFIFLTCNTKTISCDFHMHTVFSDGSVWPDIRVSEAVREGIDCISTTEHLEYQPHSKDIPHPDRNRAYELARASARNTNLIVIAGSEITRQMPPGHSNAIFINDANPILTEDPMDAFEEATGKAFILLIIHNGQLNAKMVSLATIQCT